MQVKKLTVLVILCVLSLFLATQLDAQHFEWINTDVSMSIILNAAVLDDESLIEGDEVGMFTEAGLCAGATVIPADFPDEAVGLSPWQAEAGEENGFAANEVINFVYWENEAEIEWDAASDRVIVGNADDDGNLLFVGNGFAVITLAGNRGEPVPEIDIDVDILENGHDFGTIRVNQSAEWVLEIGNSGREDLIISDITLEADNFSVEFEDDVNISPGESADISVTFAPEEEGEFGGTLVITWNDPEEGDPIEISVMGTAEPALPPAIAVDPDRLNFGDVVVEESRSSAFDITNLGDETLTISDMTIEDETFSVDFEDDINLGSGETVEFIVIFTPSGEEVFSSDVIITSNDPDNEEVSVHVTGRGVGEDAPPEIGVAEGDEEFFFGYVITGEERIWRMTLTNEGVGDLHVTDMETDNESFLVEFDNEIRLRRGDLWFIDVTFAPEEDGLYEATLTIISDDPNNEGIFEIPLGGVAGEDRGMHFQWAGTENSANILVAEATLDGDDLVEGDEIGIYTQRGLLAGGGVVQDDGRAGLVAMGDEPGTEIIDGFVEDEEFRFLVWDADADVEVWGVAEFLSGPEAYVANGFSRINLAAETGEPAGQISLDDIRHFFGQVEIEDDSREWAFTIENVGLGELIIESIESDLNEYTTDFGDEEVVLEPEGGSIDVIVTFEPIEERRYIGRLAINSNDPRNEVVYVDLIGDGVVEARNPGLELSQPNWFFGVIPVDVERTYILVITSSGGADLELQGISFEGDEVFSTEFPDQNPLLEPGDSFDLPITFLPDEEREFSGVFTIETNLIEEEPVTFPVSGFGRVSEDHFMHFDTGIDHLFTISSAVIRTAQDNLVPLYPGDEIAVLTPLGLIAGHVVIEEENAPIGLAAYADDPDNEVLVGFQDGEEFAFVFWDISTENEIDCEVEFIEGPEEFDPNGESEINLSAEAAEEEPLILVEPLVLQFPPTLVNETSEDIFTISNIGGANLTLDGYESEDEEFELDLDNEIVLEPGESVEIAASFTPSAAAGFEGNILVMSDDPHVPAFMIHPVGIGSDHEGHFLFGTTDVNHSIIIDIEGGVGGVNPSAGDEVGVFTPDGLCAGATIYEPGEDFGIAAWGDEANNLLIEGFVQDEEMTFLFYDESQDRVYEPEVDLIQGSLDWTPNGFSVIEMNVPGVISIVQVEPINVDEGDVVEFQLVMSVDEGDWEFEWTNEDEYENIPDGVFTVENNVGTFSWETTFDDAGEYLFTFSATDGDIEDFTSVEVTVNDINRAPEVDGDVLGGLQLEYNEDTIQQFIEVFLFEELFIDPDGDEMLFSRAFVGEAPDGFEHRIEVDEEGLHHYEIRADENWSGEVDIELRANDQRGDGRDEGIRQVRMVSGNQPERDLITVLEITIVVVDFNDDPIFTAPDDADNDGQADEDVQGTEGEELVIQFAATDEEDDDAALNFDISDRDGLPDDGPVLVDNDDGTATFTWTPNFDEAAEYNPTFQVTDSDGATDDITVTIIIANVNQQPEVANPIEDLTGDAAIVEDADRLAVADLNEVFNDPDVGDVLNFEIRESPDELQVLIDPDSGVLSLQPIENYHTVNDEGGLDELLITVAANDEEAAITESFLVSVLSVNDAPMDFNLLTPEDNHDISYDPDSMGTLDFSWEQAAQVMMELDTVRYIVQFWAEDSDTMASDLLDDTSYVGIEIDMIAEFILRGPGQREEDVVVSWQIFAYDSTEALLAANAPFNFTIPALGVDPEDQAGIPIEYFMSPAFPNPFNMETTVKFGIPQPGLVSITVWDMHGRQVADILNTQLSAGSFSAIWNANGLTSGIYMIRMHSGNFNKLQKAVLIR